MSIIDVLPDNQRLRDLFVCDFQANIAAERAKISRDGPSPENVDTSTLEGQVKKHLRESELRYIRDIARKEGISIEAVPDYIGNATYGECARERGLDPQGRRK